jgi:hypothetical protein
MNSDGEKMPPDEPALRLVEVANIRLSKYSPPARPSYFGVPTGVDPAATSDNTA